MVEQHTLETLEGAKARITFQVSGENTAGEYQKIVKKYAKSIDLKGFRKGKVPVDLLERKFGKEFRAEAFQQVLEQCTKETLPNVEPKALGYSQPFLCDAEGNELPSSEAAVLIQGFQPGQGLEFALAYETSPEVPLATLDGLDFEALTVAISDADVDTELRQLREQNAVMIERNSGVGSDGDLLSMQFALLGEGQTEVAEIAEDAKLRTIVRLGEEDAHGFQDKVKDMQKGETKVLKGHSFPDETRVEGELRGKSGDVWLEVSHIRTRELPELDDDFAQDIDEKYETVADLQAATREKLQHDAEHVAESYALLQIYRHWASSLNFAIPSSMVAYQTQSVMDKIKQRMGGKEQDLMMYLAMQHGGDAQKGLQALEKETLLSLFIDLVRDNLLESKNWQASDEEIEKELEQMARQRGGTVSELKERYKDQWEQVEEYLGQQALFARLNKQMIAEASAGTTAVEMTVSELKKKLSELESVCQDLVYQKFSPFAKV